VIFVCARRLLPFFSFSSKVASPSQVQAAEEEALASGLIQGEPLKLMCISYCVQKKHGTAIEAVRHHHGVQAALDDN
jgi:hypothetical protein